MIDVLGFTGTQNGCTSKQHSLLVEVLDEFRQSGILRLHHGDCVGADATAHLIWKSLGGVVTIHPPTNPAKRAYCWKAASPGDLILPGKDYLRRNQDIIIACNILVATPASMTEYTRSGTWATIRYARKQGRKTIIIFPDGSTTSEAGSA